jgi:hypothetical protein
MNLYDNYCMLGPLGHKLRAKIYALKMLLTLLVLLSFASFIVSFQHIK